MSRGYAVEVVLTRSATAEEAGSLEARLPGCYAFRADRTRATTVVSAEDAALALDEAWAQTTSNPLPVDVIWTLYPDGEGMVQLLLDLDAGTEARLRERADRGGLTVDDLVQAALHEALERDTAQRRARLREQLAPLLQRSSLEDVLRALLAVLSPKGA